MFNDEFEKLHEDEVAIILDRIQDDLDVPFDPIETDILAGQVPFYFGYRLLEIISHGSVPSMKVYVVYSDDRWVVIDYTATALKTLNAEVPVKLDKSNVLDYVRFYFSFVSGVHAKYSLLESVEDIQWREEPSVQMRKSLANAIHPLMLKKSSLLKVGKGFYTQASVLMDDNLVTMDVTVSMDGGVKFDVVTLHAQNLSIINTAVEI